VLIMRSGLSLRNPFIVWKRTVYERSEIDPQSGTDLSLDPK
jgi:hypothetical protein